MMIICHFLQFNDDFDKDKLILIDLNLGSRVIIISMQIE